MATWMASNDALVARWPGPFPGTDWFRVRIPTRAPISRDRQIGVNFVYVVKFIHVLVIAKRVHDPKAKMAGFHPADVGSNPSGRTNGTDPNGEGSGCKPEQRGFDSLRCLQVSHLVLS